MWCSTVNLEQILYNRQQEGFLALLNIFQGNTSCHHRPDQTFPRTMKSCLLFLSNQKSKIRNEAIAKEL